MANRFLRWTKLPNAVGYDLRAKKDVDPIDTDPVFLAGDVDFVDLTKVPFLANAEGSYHFAVTALNGIGVEGVVARVTGPLAFAPLGAVTNLRLTDT